MARWSPNTILAIADEPTDDDDTRRRKRVGVLASLITIVVPWLLPVIGSSLPVTVPLAIGLSAFSVANLVLLARSRRFERFVSMLLAAGAVFVPSATFVGGGLLGANTGLAWAFLIPAYAILTLGPSRATRWYLVYLGVIVALVVLDPLAREAVSPAPYPVVILGQVQNSVIPLTVVFLLFRFTDVRRLVAEARVDELLTNAIPPPIAARLRRGERRIAEAYDPTTVVFADLVGFTPWSRQTTPSDVVATLDALFTRFDALAAEHGLEKIKTIGDAYMAVAGAPEPRPDHAAAALAFARGLLAAVVDTRVARGIDLQVRVGLATGPVIGGVIGTRRLLFDLWGDTVNLASRMESSGVPGRIQLAESTRDALDDAETLVARTVEVKGLGPLTTYLVP